MTTHVPINIYEYRLGDAPEGFWRYIYDRYPSGKPVDEATDTQGRAVFAAYRTNAPGTVPIYLHQYAHAEPSEPNFFRRFTTEGERTPHAYELDEKSSGSERERPTGSIDGHKFPDGTRTPDTGYEGPDFKKKSNISTRAFWAFPASSGVNVTVAVPVYEHRLEVDFVGQNPPPAGHRPLDGRFFLMGRCATYIKYSTRETGGGVFEKREDARDLSTPSAAWWRMVTAQ